MPIRKPWSRLTAENIAQLPESDGVYELGNEEEATIFIAGAPNLREALREHLDGDDECLGQARLFRYEEIFMYTMRESELLQKFIRENNRLPECNI